MVIGGVGGFFEMLESVPLLGELLTEREPNNNNKAQRGVAGLSIPPAAIANAQLAEVAGGVSATTALERAALLWGEVTVHEGGTAGLVGVVPPSFGVLESGGLSVFVALALFAIGGTIYEVGGGFGDVKLTDPRVVGTDSSLPHQEWDAGVVDDGIGNRLNVNGDEIPAEVHYPMIYVESFIDPYVEAFPHSDSLMCVESSEVDHDNTTVASASNIGDIEELLTDNDSDNGEENDENAINPLLLGKYDLDALFADPDWGMLTIHAHNPGWLGQQIQALDTELAKFHEGESRYSGEQLDNALRNLHHLKDRYSVDIPFSSIPGMPMSAELDGLFSRPNVSSLAAPPAGGLAEDVGGEAFEVAMERLPPGLRAWYERVLGEIPSLEFHITMESQGVGVDYSPADRLSAVLGAVVNNMPNFYPVDSDIEDPEELEEIVGFNQSLFELIDRLTRALDSVLVSGELPGPPFYSQLAPNHVEGRKQYRKIKQRCVEVGGQSEPLPDWCNRFALDQQRWIKSLPEQVRETFLSATEHAQEFHDSPDEALLAALTEMINNYYNVLPSDLDYLNTLLEEDPVDMEELLETIGYLGNGLGNVVELIERIYYAESEGWFTVEEFYIRLGRGNRDRGFQRWDAVKKTVSEANLRLAVAKEYISE